MEETQTRPAIPRELGDRIKRFIEEHPDMGEHSLSGFVVRACTRHLEYLNRQLYLERLLRGEIEASPDVDPANP